ncbi:MULTISPECIES: hypothetical protein [Rhizobium]|uniref:Uncharacterized protein n=1 Tax=Rhizobium phaseoli TaxID=396 RepID=A0A7X6EVD3_9HYPH|nr:MULTISPECIES: hypothetical protein [Rhizobium]MDE8758017.1 hypothetical protein [Rhizobium sp. CBK13]NKF09319.1 hypothetical protein [Rhizobium phaseoli]QPK12993.1 hypothetical protein HER27_028930 [Rhizobium phaseoli]
MTEVRKVGPSASGSGYDDVKPPWRMMIFVITIFLLACLAALAFVLTTYPGESDDKSATPATEQAR